MWPQARRDDLTQAALSDDLKELAENPMLLTTMAIIHQRDVGLPKERVRLYHQAVTVLLHRWQRHKGTQASPSARRSAGRRTQDARHFGTTCP